MGITCSYENDIVIFINDVEQIRRWNTVSKKLSDPHCKRHNLSPRNKLSQAKEENIMETNLDMIENDLHFNF